MQKKLPDQPVYERRKGLHSLILLLLAA